MSSVVIAGDTSGSITLSAPAVAGTNILTLPSVTDTLTGIAATQTLTNKTLTSPTITTPTISSLSSASATTLTLQSAGTTAVTIDTSQNATFTKNITTNGGKFAIQSSGTEYGYISTASGDVTFGSSNGGYLKLISNSSLILGVTSGGESFRAVNTGFQVAGALSKGSGSFKIEHPLPSLSETHQLVHSFIEGPQADLIYRGKVSLVNGQAQINIDSTARMTEGTFEVLCRDIQCFTTNESDWTPVRGSVTRNILTIEAQDQTSTASISWMVIGERQDKHMYETDWTDENGKVIVEPLKVIDERASL